MISTRPPKLSGIVRFLTKIPGLTGVAELVKTLVIDKRDTIESRLVAADGTANSLLENDTTLLETSVYLLEALQKGRDTASRENQVLLDALQQAQNEEKQDRQTLLAAFQRTNEELDESSRLVREAVQQSLDDAKRADQTFTDSLQELREEAKQQSEVLLAALQRVAEEAVQEARNEAQHGTKTLEDTLHQSSDEGKPERNSILAALQQADQQADRRIQLLRRSVQKAQDTKRKHQALVDAARGSRHEVQLHSRSLQEQINLAHRESDEQNAKLLQDLHALAGQTDGLNARTNVVTTKYPFLNPEVGLMAHLYSFLPNRTALDIGANVGDVSECLLRAGYEVHAFEPFQPVFEKLQQRLSSHPRFHAYQLAIGGADETMELHVAVNESGADDGPDPTLFNSLTSHPLPEGMVFRETVPVTVRTMETLHASEEIPSGIGLVKIDTEGLDLEVVRRMGPQRYPVVLTEFWDTEILFSQAGATNRLEDLIEEMRTRGYLWHIVIYRIWGSHDIGFYCNYQQSVSNSWGNICFFTDYSTFSEARRWCTAVLPMTYFQP